MTPHKPRKPAPVEYTTDEEDMIVYDIEEELSHIWLLRHKPNTHSLPHKNVTNQVLISKQLSQGNAPTVLKLIWRSMEKARTGSERLYSLHKRHTTQVTASKARQGRLKSHGSPAL
ncbi:hypothetical protein TNCV_3063001 [Trichonephila clavipes]|nr:hypothetical protein TNCV_3063001 [Trichonephila clavipes]